MSISVSCAHNMDSAGVLLYSPPQQHRTEDNITVKITPVKRISGYDVNRYFEVFYVEITNNSDKRINFDSGDIVIVDGFNTQYNTLPPDSVAGIISAELAPRVSPRISVGIGAGYYSRRAYYHGYHHYHPLRPFSYSPYHFYYDDFYYRDRYYNRMKDLDFIYRNALLPGTVLPGSKLAGFVYFNKTPSDVQNISFYFTYGIEETSLKRELVFNLAR